MSDESPEPRRLPDRQTWSQEIDVAVSSGTRRLSLLPLPGGRCVVVDSTGANMYGLLVLGELLPLPDGGFRAVDPHGVEVVVEQEMQGARALFDAHPERLGILDCGT